MNAKELTPGEEGERAAREAVNKKQRDDGGPQYPTAFSIGDDGTGYSDGISRLDFLAGQIAAAYVASNMMWNEDTQPARWAYDLAEALIAEGRRREQEASK